MYTSKPRNKKKQERERKKRKGGKKTSFLFCNDLSISFIVCVVLAAIIVSDKFSTFLV
jgi:hypothetical protein